jgi:hypothetical protein
MLRFSFCLSYSGPCDNFCYLGHLKKFDLHYITLLGAAGGVAGGVASAVSASNNAKAAATAQAELERHNREVEAQLKTGSGVITDYLKQLLQKLGLTIRDYYKIIKGRCVRCGKGLYIKPHGSGLYIGPKI